MTIISIYLLTDRALEYFGDDVQSFWIERRGSKAPYRYDLKQRPHYYPVRVAASCYAMTAAKARAEFNAIAKVADRRVA